MRSFGGFVGLLVMLVVGLLVYKASFTPGPNGELSPVQRLLQTYELAGVKNDLAALAEAERTYLASHDEYVDLDELREEGSSTLLPHGDRRGYKYSIEIDSDQHFKIIATPSDLETKGWPTITIDETMQISEP
jgi:hypothetical protein